MGMSFAVAGILTAITSISFGIFVYFKNRNNEINKIWVLMSLSAAFWALGFGLIIIAKNKKEAIFWLKSIHLLGTIFIPVVAVHFILAFLDMHKIKKKLLIFLYSISLILQISNFAGLLATVKPKGPFNYYVEPGIFYPFYVVLFFSCVSYCYYLLFVFYKKSFGRKKNQIKYVFLSAIIAFSTGSTAFFMVFNIPILPYGIFFIFLYIPIMAYAIVKHHLMNIEIVMQKVTRIIVSFLIAVGVYFGFFYLGYNIISWGGWKASVFAIFPCLICFIYLIWRMQKVIFSKEEDYQQALIRTAGEMVRIKDPLKLVEKVADSVYNIIESRQVSIFLLDVSTKEYFLQTSKGRIPYKITNFRLKKESPIINWFSKKGEKFYKNGLIKEEEKDFLQLDIIKQWQQSDKFLKEKEEMMLLENIQVQMELLRTSLIIPSRYGKKILGIFCLGGREQGEYTQNEVEILSGFADDVAMNIKNAFLISDLRQKIHEKTKLSKELYDAYQKVEKNFKNIVAAFAMTVNKMDPFYTYEHVEKTFKYAQKLLAELQYAETKEKGFFQDMFFAGILLHDIGKIFIPKSILNKKETLTKEEWEIIRKHPVDGYELLIKIEGMEISARVIRHHHERFDGKGYPDKLEGKKIPIGARIVSVVDAFEAMTSDRPYRKAKPKAEAIKELLVNSGSQFDPLVVKVFVKLYEKGEI